MSVIGGGTYKTPVKQMALCYNVRTGGKGHVTLGEKRVNGYNVYPSTVTATASGVVLTPTQYDNYEMFNVEQTDGATNKVLLPDLLPQGAVILLYATEAFWVGTESTDCGINAGGGNDYVAIPQYSTAVCTKTASDNVVIHILDDDGTIDIPSLTS